MIAWLLKPQAGVNYNYICLLQLVGVIICFILICTQFILEIETTKGWFIIFSPFIPTLLWTYSVKNLAEHYETKEG